MFIFGASGIFLFLLLVLWIWALFDVVVTPGASCRNLPKLVWLVLVVLVPDIGAVAWILVGRPKQNGWRPGSVRSGPGRPAAPEDRAFLPADSAIITDRRSAELDRRLDEFLAGQESSPPSDPVERSRAEEG